MSEELKMSEALARIMVKRIAKALYQAKYYPKRVPDEKAAAEEVVRPFVIAKGVAK